jgi:hypothetical protein
MAAIRARKLADGSVRYTAQIRIKRAGVQVYQESQTFARKQAAQAWARKRESELYEPGAIERASRKGSTAKEMIDQYLREVEKARPLGKPKRPRSRPSVPATSASSTMPTSIRSAWWTSRCGG